MRISSGARIKRSAGTAAVLTATVLSVVVGFAAVGTIPADAHELDLMTPDHAGPIVRNETTIGDLRGWFGAPTSRKVIEEGCQDVVSARWGHDLEVYAYRAETRTVGAVFVRSDSIPSDEHGELSLHTRSALQVGDRERKLRRLYPRSPPMTHAQHTHYRLREDDLGARLMAKVVDGRVVQLESWPLEFC